MKLTVEQINFFHVFGYLVVPRVFDQEEMERIVEGFEWSIKNCGAGKEHDGSMRTMFCGPIEHTPEMCTLLDLPGLLNLVGALIGEDFNYCGGDGNYYTGDTGWHPDGNWGQLFSVKVAFYLDELTRDTGCLRVIPRSHCADHVVRKEKINLNHSMELFGVPPRDFPGNVALETNPGDIAVFNHDTYHAAFGGGETRRMFTMNCTRHGKMPEGIELNYRYLKMHGPGGYNVFTGAGMYFPTMLDTANNERMLYLEQPAKIHDEIFPHLARGNLDKVIVMSQEVSMLQSALRDICGVSLPSPGLTFEVIPEGDEKNLASDSDCQMAHVDLQRSHGGKDGLLYIRTTLFLREEGLLTISYDGDAPEKDWINNTGMDVESGNNKCQTTGACSKGEHVVLFAICSNYGKTAGLTQRFLLS